MTKKTINRTQAAFIIDHIRELVSIAKIGRVYGRPMEQADYEKKIAELDEFLSEQGIPLLPCAGEAHSNGQIDHCSSCAPRWGWVGPKVSIR